MDLLAQLRSATRATHERVEGRIDVLSRLSDAASYRSLLESLLDVYEPLENSVSMCSFTETAVPDWPRRLKSRWLTEDLRSVADVAPSASSTFPVPAWSSSADVIGAVYVMEGATLGGAIIDRAVREGSAALPTRFFTSYGAQRAAMWAAFRGHVRAFEERELSGVYVAEAVSAAERTFSAIELSCCSAAR